MRTSTIELRVSRYAEDDSFEVRPIVDGSDVLARYWDDMLGTPPEALFPGSSPAERPSELHGGEMPHRANVAQCSCGTFGCAGISVEIVQEGDKVIWRDWEDEGGRPEAADTLYFDAASYHAELERVADEACWISVEEKVIRLVSQRVDRTLLARHELTLEWSSASPRSGYLSIALHHHPGPHLLVLHHPIPDTSPEAAAESVCRLLAGDPTTWTDVEWQPRRHGFEGPPAIAGPTWRKIPPPAAPTSKLARCLRKLSRRG